MPRADLGLRTEAKRVPGYELLSAVDPRVEGGLEHYGPDAFTYLGLGFRRDRVELVGARVIPNVVPGRDPLEVSLLVRRLSGSSPRATSGVSCPRQSCREVYARRA